MDRRHVLTVFASWVTRILLAVPAKLRPTFLELIFGCIIARTGHITDAFLSIVPEKTWTTYYKAIEKGVFSWLAIIKQWTLLLCEVLTPEEITIGIDDTFCFRSSKKAPSVGLHHDHAKRTNRPKYVWAQLLVGAALICTYKGRSGAFPLFMKMNRLCGNRSKIKAAIVIIRILAKWLGKEIPVRILMDAWYMKGPVVLEILSHGYHALGQARRDSALYLHPEKPKGPKSPGRPRKYGLKVKLPDVKSIFIRKEANIIAYGKERPFQYYTFTALVRFLKGRECRIVWSRFQRSNGDWTKWHLLISTDISLSGFDVIQKYAARWWIESCFNELKNIFGFKDTWQQTRQVAARWRCIVCIAYGLTRLLAMVYGPSVAQSMMPIPWRKNCPATAGWVAKAAAKIFRNYRVRRFWDRKQQKCFFPEQILSPKTGSKA